MRSILIALVASLALCACGDDGASSKQNNATSNNQVVNNGNANNENNGNVNNTTVNNVNNAASLMELFGTEGPIDMTPKSPGGNALCDLAAIRTDDLNNEFSDEVPPMSWDSSPVADEPSRCGDDAETAVWRLNNCERIGRDLAPFECDLRLVWLGRAHSQDMIDRGFFSHTNPDNESPFERMEDADISSSASGENIAQNDTAEGAHLSWMDSSGHRRNMLGGYTHAGAGFEGNLYTTGFITR